MSIVTMGLALVAGAVVARGEPVRVYTLELKGTFGREVAPTPVREAMEEAAHLKADVILLRLDADYTPGTANEGGRVSGADWQMTAAREIVSTVLPSEGTGLPRVVCWLKRAEGGAAWLALGMPKLVYTPNAVHDPVVDMFTDTSELEQITREKHRSLRQGRLEGIALAGGHPMELMRAMTRRSYVLSVSFHGDEAEFFEDASGQTMLTTADDLLRLDAAMSLRLGVSCGTALYEKDLWSAVGIDSAGVRHVGDSRDEMERWRRGVFDAEREVTDLVIRFNDLRIAAPGGYDERAAARAERTQIARDILSRLDKFGNALDAEMMGKSRDELHIWCTDAIAKLRLAQMADRKQ